MAEFRSAVAVALSLLFIISGGSKTLNNKSFQAGVGDYQILPPNLVTPFAWLAALTELGGGVLILTPASALAGAVLAGLVWEFCRPVPFGLQKKLRRGIQLNGVLVC